MKSATEIRKSMTMGVTGRNKLRALSDFTVEHRTPQEQAESVIDFADIMATITAARDGVLTLQTSPQQETDEAKGRKNDDPHS